MDILIALYLLSALTTGVGLYAAIWWLSHIADDIPRGEEGDDNED